MTCGLLTFTLLEALNQLLPLFFWFILHYVSANQQYKPFVSVYFFWKIGATSQGLNQEISCCWLHIPEHGGLNLVTVILGHDARVIPCIFLKIMVHLSYVSGGLACGRRKQRIPASIHLLASAVNCIVKLVLLKNSKFSLYINLQKNKIFRIRYFWSHHLCHQLCLESIVPESDN